MPRYAGAARGHPGDGAPGAAALTALDETLVRQGLQGGPDGLPADIMDAAQLLLRGQQGVRGINTRQNLLAQEHGDFFVFQGHEYHL